MRKIITQLCKIISLLLIVGIGTGIAMVDFPSPPILSSSPFEILSVLSPDGTKKAGVLDDHAIQIWDIKTSKLIYKLHDPATRNNTAHY